MPSILDALGVRPGLTDRVEEALAGIRIGKAFAQQERQINAFLP
jgi:hypothetical protein